MKNLNLLKYTLTEELGVPLGKIHRRRLSTEEKAKVVAAVWRTELIQFLDTLAVLHLDSLKERIPVLYTEPGLYEEKD